MRTEVDCLGAFPAVALTTKRLDIGDCIATAARQWDDVICREFYFRLALVTPEALRVEP